MPKKEEDEDTTHAIVIADEKEGETENETAERTRLRITNPQKAKKTIETRGGGIREYLTVGTTGIRKEYARMPQEYARMPS